MNGSVLRLLDANANRAREGLRVMEDYARFVLDCPELCSGLKSIRHDLTAALSPYLSEAILHRDTPGDVGTHTKTPAEGIREDVAAVVIAAGKRLGEALRAIEEFLKTLNPVDAAKIEGIRYRFYDLEQRLSLSLRPAGRMADVRLYVLITQALCRRPWLAVAEAAILGGADCLQLREKEMDGAQFLDHVRQLVNLCHRHGVFCIINDRVDLAILAGADGVHVGQDDLPARDVRKLGGSRMIVGVSTHRIEQAKAAVADGADYIGVGPIFKSGTKPRDFIAGTDYARQVAGSIHIPAIAIAGIDETNIDEVLGTGIKAVAVSAAVIASDDPRAAAERLKAKMKKTEAK